MDERLPCRPRRAVLTTQQDNDVLCSVGSEKWSRAKNVSKNTAEIKRFPLHCRPPRLRWAQNPFRRRNKMRPALFFAVGKTVLATGPVVPNPG